MFFPHDAGKRIRLWAALESENYGRNYLTRALTASTQTSWIA